MKSQPPLAIRLKSEYDDDGLRIPAWEEHFGRDYENIILEPKLLLQYYLSRKELLFFY